MMLKYPLIDAVSRLFPGHGPKHAEHALDPRQYGNRILPADRAVTLVPGDMPDRHDDAEKPFDIHYSLG
jgi:hypothetical protein